MTPMTVPRPLRIVRLDIQDFVLVERLDLELRPGLNVLSGGSGEGKTLVVRALEFLLAGQPYGRASAGRWLRQGAA
ncbi:MAG: AAA family ATPase, partial [Planctomycetota bacterium]|nr:AAA family ATPase [Planctomycetota bacterium]